jgi:Raf kinase inhibitor-like YbhB/YbcL family protein
MRVPVTLVAIAGLFGGCANQSASAQRGSLTVEVRDVHERELMPERFTCEGADTSPPLSWSGVPREARSLVLIVDDPDAPRGTFTHWVVYDLPPTERGLEAGQPRDARLENGGVQGTNDFRRVGWNGPCPPAGRAHRYRFTVHAMDRMLEIAPGADRARLDRAMSGHSIANGTFVARFRR